MPMGLPPFVLNMTNRSPSTVRLSRARPISSANATTYHSSLMNGVSRSAIRRIAFRETRSSDGCGRVMMNSTLWVTAGACTDRVARPWSMPAR